MRFYNRIEAVCRMNRLGAERRPFLFVIDYKQDRVIVEEPDKVDPGELLYNLEGVTNAAAASRMKTPENRSSAIRWETFPVTQEDYAGSFHKVVGHIRAGNSYLVNLTCATSVRTNLDLKEVFVRSEARYKLWMKDRFVVFSPEIFVKIRDGHIYSYPMKGTIDATLADARRRILDDPKETAEHATIVDLIRNDLSMVATEVTVTRYRYIDELPTHKGALLQVSSEIRGRLEGNWQAETGELLFRLLPAGSITGAPKKKTMEIIAEAETYERGFYTGVMGYFDGNSLNSAVMIRFLEQQADGSLIFKSGGGITSQSDLESEYNEMKQKVYVPIY
ncbi:aminodeoxychorismate synthase component I [uncultured Parabacteroides sp.]|jgi:para-aminobenzoate synthetase component 1|uniref:aminodeoxychorismate synthase component I n=1 Tax=uncultured Parabacteroides sp. TaxID=512312 RepID=UPI0025EF2ACC|nr:aminodeoxychorismate synthase component I [uncultured Parabacteroides sp.]